MRKTFSLILLMLVVPAALFASWTAGVFGGADVNFPVRNTAYAQYKFSEKAGYTAGASVSYSFNDHFAVKSGITLLNKRYHLSHEINNQLYTDFNDLYAVLPVMADFSVTGKKLTGHAYAGAYAGIWASKKESGLYETAMDQPEEQITEIVSFDSDKDARFNAGALCGLGVSYALSSNLEILLDSLFYFDLTSYVKQSSSIAKEYRYNRTLTVQLGLTYKFQEGGNK